MNPVCHACLVLLAMISLGNAQIAPPPPPPAASDQQFRFSVSVQMVVLQATVLTPKGSFVRGLRQNNFELYEDGQRQTIGLFGHQDTPVAIGLLVDNSGSMRRKHSAVVAAAKAFARNSNPNDELFVVNFSDRPTLGLPRTRLFSANARELERALPTGKGLGQTAIYDAIELGLSHMHQLKQDKKALILISDGGDNASKHSLQQVINDATNSDVVIYTIGLFGKDDEETDPSFMKRIAFVTGGEAFLPSRANQASSNCKRIAQTIRNEYTLGYTPPGAENSIGKFRAINLRVNKARSPKLLARTRIGYTPGAALPR
jgi:Ca-activated chloride channel homolog